MGKKKMKGVAVVESDAKARQRRDDLMQDYQELQKETDDMRSKLEVAKQKRRLLAAEVRFLRRKHKHLIKEKKANFSQERMDVEPTSLKQAKNTRGGILVRKEASQHRLPPLPDSRPSKKRCTSKQAAMSSSSPSTVLACKELFCGEKERTRYSGVGLGSDADHKQQLQGLVPILDRERVVSGLALRHSIGDFDLNQRGNSSKQEASLLNQAPMFDLNEISTGEEDLKSNNVEEVKFEEAKKSLMISVNDEPQNDLKLFVCRNAGEGSTHVGSRKFHGRIQWCCEFENDGLPAR